MLYSIDICNSVTDRDNRTDLAVFTDLIKVLYFIFQNRNNFI